MSTPKAVPEQDSHPFLPEQSERREYRCADDSLSSYRHNVGPDIEATQRRNHMDYSTAGRMVYDVLDAFCPQYGDNPNPPGPHVDIGY
jgi:hypothetical protein